MPGSDTPLVTAQSGALKPWSHYMLDIYVSKKGPPLGTLYIHEVEELAREALKDRKGTPRPFDSTWCIAQEWRCYYYTTDAFLYSFCSAGEGHANVANVAEVNKWKLIPRMLRDATKRSLDVRT